MNLNQLEYFVTVAENLNFTRAAAKCFISQTAMTQQIRSLEKQIGTALFIRDKHHVELTSAGKVFLREAYMILDRTNEAMRMARLASDGITGEITLGYIRGFGQSDFFSTLRNFHQTYPNIKLKLIKDNSSVLLDSLEKKECDIVFSIASKTKYSDTVSHLYLKSYPIMGVLYPEHPLANQSFLTYEDLKNDNFIMMQPPTRQKDQMEESMLIYERGGYLPNVVSVEGDQENLLLMISAGMGISLLPEYITRIHSKNPHLKILPMLKQDGTAETIDFGASWLRDNSNKAVEQFITLLK